MNIGIDARLTYYRTGGISTYIRNMIHAFARLSPPHRLTVFQSRRANAPLTDAFPRARLWTPAHHQAERTALSVELARFPLDVWHTTDFIPPRFGARRFVITVHDLTFLHYPDFLTAESRRYYNQQIHAAVARADHILTISESSRQDIMALLGVPQEKITVHPLGTDASFCPQPPAAVAATRAALELPPAYILSLSTFEPRKNILGLLEAYQGLRHALPSAPPLVIAGGRGWLFEETLAKIEQMHLTNSVYLREKIPQRHLPALYTGATALVMASFYEGFGLPALEAMACGTVPIVSNVSSLPEVVGPVGAQIDPHNPATLQAALERAVTDDAWREAQAAAALQRAALFTWDDTARIALHVYERVIH